MAIMPNEIQQVVMQLLKLNERELIEILNQVFEVHARRFDGNGMNPDFGDRYALVKSHFIKGEDQEPYVQFLSIPSEPYLSRPHDEALESGGCPTCGVSLACTDKLATCPVCDTTRVECT